MDKEVVDPAMRAQLHQLRDALEFCHETGRTLGHFLPTDVYRELVLAWSRAQSSDEELERRRKEPGGRTLGEIWKRLGRT
jgi:hypothetical protein